MNTQKQKEILRLLKAGKYFATRDGRVGSRARGYEIYLSPSKSPNGYFMVTLMGARRITVLVHQVVFLFFRGAYSPSLTINHKDGKKLRNEVKNLELCTKLEQQAHAFSKGLRKRRLSDVQLRRIQKMRDSKKVSWRYLGEKFGMSEAGIRKVVNYVNHRN